MDTNERIKDLIVKSFENNLDEALQLIDNKEIIKEVFESIFYNSFKVLTLKSLFSDNLRSFIYENEDSSIQKTNDILLYFKIIKGIDFKNVFEDGFVKILNIEDSKYYSINNLKELTKLDFNLSGNVIPYKSKFNFIVYED